jgi:hypothetical protein
MPNAIHMVGDEIAAIAAAIIPQMPKTYCRLKMAMIERINDSGTKTMAKMKIPNMPNTNPQTPTAEPVC